MEQYFNFDKQIASTLLFLPCSSSTTWFYVGLWLCYGTCQSYWQDCLKTVNTISQLFPAIGIQQMCNVKTIITQQNDQCTLTLQYKLGGEHPRKYPELWVNPSLRIISLEIVQTRIILLHGYCQGIHCVEFHQYHLLRLTRHMGGWKEWFLYTPKTLSPGGIHFSLFF